MVYQTLQRHDNLYPVKATRASIAAPASPDGKTAVVGDQVAARLSTQEVFRFESC